jgi:predicted SAM-dependent methyltransferase
MLNGEHLLLDLASGNPEEGEIRPEGYLYQDIEPHKGIDLVCDLEELNKYVKLGQCKQIRISHALEHFPTSHVSTILTMLYGLLEDEGILEIHVPNLQWHLQLLSEGKDEEAVNYVFGGQRDQYDFHKTGFTPSIIVQRLIDAGFKIKDMQIEHSIHVIAVKN